VRQIEEGQFDPDDYFGEVDSLDIEEAFLWFDIARRDLEANRLKRKSSAGFVTNTLVNQSLADFVGITTNKNNNYKLHTSGTMLGLSGQRNLSIIMGGGDINELMSSNSSSDNEGGDEVEKFKNTFLNNKNLLLGKQQ
jgi:hypothetical protein